MRQLFLILAKLLGLLQIYWTLAIIFQVVGTFGMFLFPEPPIHGQVVFIFVGLVLYTVCSFGMAWLLLARTEWLADILKIKAEDESHEIGEDILLRAGVKLIGVYIIASAVPGLVKALPLMVPDYSLGDDLLQWVKVLAPALELALGLFLALKSHTVITLIAGESTSIEPMESTDDE